MSSGIQSVRYLGPTQAQPPKQEEVPVEVSETYFLGVRHFLVLPGLSERACSKSDPWVARLQKHSGDSPEWLIPVFGLRWPQVAHQQDDFLVEEQLPDP